MHKEASKESGKRKEDVWHKKKLRGEIKEEE